MESRNQEPGQGHINSDDNDDEIAAEIPESVPKHESHATEGSVAQEGLEQDFDEGEEDIEHMYRSEMFTTKGIEDEKENEDDEDMWVGDDQITAGSKGNTKNQLIQADDMEYTKQADV